MNRMNALDYTPSHDWWALGLVPAMLGLLGLALLNSGCSSAPASTSSSSGTKTASESVPSVETVKVIVRQIDMKVPLPAELQPYEAVAIYPKVTGFVKSIAVDRGSRVRKGQFLAQLEAPEIASQKAEAQAKVEGLENQHIEAEAKLAADQGTYERLKAASATPGVISDNELDVAKKVAEADRARMTALHNTTEAAKAALRSMQVMEGYLRITAPFNGIITERNVHPGALVGPAGGTGAQAPMLRIQNISHLRLVVAVPEAYVAGIVDGARVNFTVPAFPGRTFVGRVARIAATLDVKTRTMPVELDFLNPHWELNPGMFPTVSWPVHRLQPSLLVPQSSVIRTSRGTFVIRVAGGSTEWVNVKQGVSSGNDTEVFGELHPDDNVVLHGSEELRPNTRVSPRVIISKNSQ